MPWASSRGLARSWTCRWSRPHADARLREGLIDTANAGPAVRTDTDFRSERNEARLGANGMANRIHRTKPRIRPMSEQAAKDNGRKSAARTKVGPVFTRQKNRLIGSPRTSEAISLASMVVN